MEFNTALFGVENALDDRWAADLVDLVDVLAEM